VKDLPDRAICAWLEAEIPRPVRCRRSLGVGGPRVGASVVVVVLVERREPAEQTDQLGAEPVAVLARDTADLGGLALGGREHVLGRALGPRRAAGFLRTRILGGRVALARETVDPAALLGELALEPADLIGQTANRVLGDPAVAVARGPLAERRDGLGREDRLLPDRLGVAVRALEQA